MIGRSAYAFWRDNRPGDFRASGSHLIDYEADVPEAVVRQCIEWSTCMGFDSMAYDIVFADDTPLVLEISYDYVASALASAPCHWTLGAGRGPQAGQWHCLAAGACGSTTRLGTSLTDDSCGRHPD